VAFFQDPMENRHSLMTKTCWTRIARVTGHHRKTSQQTGIEIVSEYDPDPEFDPDPDPDIDFDFDFD